MMSALSKTHSAYRSITTRADPGTFGEWGPVVLRLIVGFGFIMHGYAKLARGPETFAIVLHTLGVPLPLLLAWLTTLVELVGGLAILIGDLVPRSMASLALTSWEPAQFSGVVYLRACASTNTLSLGRHRQSSA
jgi:uncharacterized membrane protein